MDFHGRVAFVTGASRGIGKCIALALARSGCDLVIAAKTTTAGPQLPGTIHQTAAEVEGLGRRALAIELDVRDDALIERAVQRALEKMERIDFLVNNAGALHWRPVAETPLKRFDLVMAVNARGAFACTHHVLPAMLSQNYGHILMMSPPVRVAGAAGKVAYAISKFGMTLLAHGLAAELEGRNVAANALWPATMIESYATINWGLGNPALWRKPEILADATLRIFAKPPASFSGHALIDEDFLRAEGVRDFSPYRCDPDHEPPRVEFDYRFEVGNR